MGKLVYLMGKSASGKDSIFEVLKEDAGLGLMQVVLYTTRPIRDNEKEGVNYYFVSIEQFEKMKQEGKVIESRMYPSVMGPWYYFTADDGQIDLAGSSYICIGTLESYHQIKEYLGEDKVMPVYIEVEDGERLLRAINREKQQKTPKYKEMCRRFIADSEDFSEEKIMAEGITKRYINDNKDECIARIRDDIIKNLNI